MNGVLSPLQLERSELGYSLQQVREGRTLRVIHRACEASDVCLFMVHGGGGRAGQFKHLIKKFENVMNVVAFDFLGHGDSPHIRDSSLYTVDEHLQDLMAVFGMYKKNKNVYVSHSYGNIHVLRHLKLLKARNKLDLIAGHVMIGLGVNAPVSLGLAGKLPSFVLEWLRPLARASSNAALFATETDPDLIKFENEISNENRMYMMKTIGLDCCNQATWTRWLEDGKQVLVGHDIPRALISGNEDGVFSLHSAETLKRRFEISDEDFHIFEGVGHIPMLERGEEVAQIIMDFLSLRSEVIHVLDRRSIGPDEDRQSIDLGGRRSVDFSDGRRSTYTFDGRRSVDLDRGRRSVDLDRGRRSVGPMRRSGSSEGWLCGRHKQWSMDSDTKSVDAYPYLTARVMMTELKQ